jgi:hypothetical protein
MAFKVIVTGDLNVGGFLAYGNDKCIRYTTLDTKTFQPVVRDEVIGSQANRRRFEKLSPVATIGTDEK